MTLCCLAGIGACALVVLGSGVFVTQFPEFTLVIVTLGTMLVASGLALDSRPRTIHLSGARFFYLAGVARVVSGIPSAVWLMMVMYAWGYLLMERNGALTLHLCDRR